MVTTRRNGVPSASPSKASLPTTSPSLTSSATPPLIHIWLIIYPLTLMLGSLFSLLDPSARAAPYSAASQSHPADLAPSYFATKKNIFNVYFVKVGWFWITASFLSFHLSRGYRPRPAIRSSAGAEVDTAEDDALARRIKGLLRWALVTAWWVFVTQWFFGAPLIDRGFRWTGGKCEVLLEQGPDDKADVLTAAACRLAGGAWTGGHDISGHVFLLVLGSAFLGMEVLPVVTDRERKAQSELGWTVWFVGGVAALSWWMILMTAAYFHTWFEKLTGLLVAFAAMGSVYYLPTMLPALRVVIGEPGP